LFARLKRQEIRIAAADTLAASGGLGGDLERRASTSKATEPEARTQWPGRRRKRSISAGGEKRRDVIDYSSKNPHARLGCLEKQKAGENGRGHIKELVQKADAKVGFG